MSPSPLHALLAGMTPRQRPGEFVFVLAQPGSLVDEEEVMASVAEYEGRSVVLERPVADLAGLDYDYVAAWITLEVRSPLAAVGLTAAVSTALAEAGLSCNVIAGYHHDHLLVPHDRAGEAIEVLTRLSHGLDHDGGRDEDDGLARDSARDPGAGLDERPR